MQAAIVMESLQHTDLGRGDPWDDFEDPEPAPGHRHAGSLFCDFTGEIDAWARHALATNGFGDF